VLSTRLNVFKGLNRVVPLPLLDDQNGCRGLGERRRGFGKKKDTSGLEEIKLQTGTCRTKVGSSRGLLSSEENLEKKKRPRNQRSLLSDKRPAVF